MLASPAAAQSLSQAIQAEMDRPNAPPVLAVATMSISGRDLWTILVFRQEPQSAERHAPPMWRVSAIHRSNTYAEGKLVRTEIFTRETNENQCPQMRPGMAWLRRAVAGDPSAFAAGRGLLSNDAQGFGLWIRSSPSAIERSESRGGTLEPWFNALATAVYACAPAQPPTVYSPVTTPPPAR